MTTSGLQTVVVPVRDLAGATALYRALLGAEPTTESPYYVGFRVGGQELGLDPHGHAAGLAAPVAYWHVDDFAATVAAVVAAGGEVVQEARDVGGGRLVGTVRDADGNVVGVLQDPSGE